MPDPSSHAVAALVDALTRFSQSDDPTAPVLPELPGQLKPLSGAIDAALDKSATLISSIEKRVKAHHDAEESYRRLEAIIPGMIYRHRLRTDGSHSFPYVSTASREIFGLEPEAIMQDGSHLSRLRHPEDVAIMEEAIRVSATTLKPFRHQVRHVVGGEVRWHEVSARPESLPDGSVLWNGIILDITTRKTAQEALRQSEENLQRIIEDSPIGITIYDSSGRCTKANKAASRLIGATHEEVLRQNYTRLQSWERSGLLEKARQTLATQTPLRHDVVTRSSFGKDVFLDCHLVPFGEGGLLLMIQDIGDRKRAEMDLRRSEYFLNKSQQVARIGYYVYDVKNHSWESSGVLDDILGIEDSHPKTPEGWMAVVAPEDRHAMRKHLFKDAIERGRRFEKEYRILRPRDRRERWVFGLGEPARDALGNTVSIVGTIQDISDRKRAETERDRLESQVFLMQKMEAIGRLAGGVAHEFNNMLSVILGYAELIKSHLAPHDPLMRDVGQIEKAGIRSRDLTRQLLAFSSKEIIAPRPLDLNELISGCRDALVRHLGPGIEFRFRPGKDLWRICFDRSQLDHILVNLAMNARRAMPEGGNLVLRTENLLIDEHDLLRHPGVDPGSYVRLMVSDDGVGMDDEVLSHVFEPFYTTKKNGPGSDLGLATVYGMVTQNGGFIDVTSAANQGTTFEIYVPRCLEEVPSEKAEDRPAPPAGSEAVLLVEDDDLVRRITATMLRELGYQVTVARDPQDALSIASEPETRIDALVTDVIMPIMSGVEVSEQVKALRPEIKVLYVSGYTDDLIGRHGVLEEGVHLLHKPYGRDELGRKLREALEQG